MILIALDEQGHFEELNIDGSVKTEEEPLFIGGVIYDDLGIDGEYNLEKKRIHHYLKGICTEVGVCYPQDLHSNGRNNRQVRLVKQKIAETLSEFMSRGVCEFAGNTWSEQLMRMPARQGKYHIFAYLKYGTEQKQMTDDANCIFIREGYASNLYVRMAEEVVERCIFHNPVIRDIRKVELNLATRRVVLEGSDMNEKAKEYIALGYREDLDPEHRQEGRRTFILTNADIYRTAIEREMLDTGKHRIEIDRIGVKAIYYGSESNSYRMEFMYMADIICSMLGYEPDTSSAENLIEDFKKKADCYTGHSDNLIFAYDEIDTLFRKAWIKLEEDDYYDALRLADLASGRDNSPYMKYYQRVWFSRMEAWMQEEKNKAAFIAAIRKYYLSTLRNDVVQDEMVDMFEIFVPMIKNMHFNRSDHKAMLYELYDAGVSSYCHIGDSIHAARCFEKCKEYAKYVEIERYLRTRNKMVVYLCDKFQFDEALDIAQENRVYQEALMNIRGAIFGKAEASKGYGIALSQLGQSYAFRRDSVGEKVFLDALAQLDPDTSDYRQTESYLLHYYLEMGEKEQYDQLAVKYFDGEKNFSKQLTYLIKEGSKGRESLISMKFALYVYIKGLYEFHLEDVHEALLKRLYDIEHTVNKAGGRMAMEQINNHPWEIIYKYLALIMVKKAGELDASVYDMKAKAEEYMQKTMVVLDDHEYTLDAICLFGQLEYHILTGNLTEAEAIMAQMIEQVSRYMPGIAEVLVMSDIHQMYDYLRGHVMTFMYR